MYVINKDIFAFDFHLWSLDKKEICCIISKHLLHIPPCNYFLSGQVGITLNSDWFETKSTSIRDLQATDYAVQFQVMI